MTNEYNQKRLNKIKWLESEKQLRDLSGEMNFCNFCEHKQGVLCDELDPNRTNKHLCATAYNRMKRKYPSMPAKYEV